MTPAADANPPATPATFEAALAQLAELVARLESGSLGLSESIDAYERGVTVLKRLHEELASAEERVSVLVRIDDEGRPILAPAATGGESAAPAESAQPSGSRPASRAQRAKTSRARSLPGMDDAGGEA